MLTVEEVGTLHALESRGAKISCLIRQVEELDVSQWARILDALDPPRRLISKTGPRDFDERFSWQVDDLLEYRFEPMLARAQLEDIRMGHGNSALGGPIVSSVRRCRKLVQASARAILSPKQRDRVEGELVRSWTRAAGEIPQVPHPEFTDDRIDFPGLHSVLRDAYNWVPKQKPDIGARFDATMERDPDGLHRLAAETATALDGVFGIDSGEFLYTKSLNRGSSVAAARRLAVLSFAAYGSLSHASRLVTEDMRGWFT